MGFLDFGLKSFCIGRVVKHWSKDLEILGHLQH